MLFRSEDMVKPAILNIRLDNEPHKVTFEQEELTYGSGYTFDPGKKRLVVYLREVRDGQLVLTE